MRAIAWLLIAYLYNCIFLSFHCDLLVKENHMYARQTDRQIDREGEIEDGVRIEMKREKLYVVWSTTTNH